MEIVIHSNFALEVFEYALAHYESIVMFMDVLRHRRC